MAPSWAAAIFRRRDTFALLRDAVHHSKLRGCSSLFAAEFVLEVEPVAADRKRVVDAPAVHAVGRPVPADARGLASHRGLRGAQRIVVAEAGAHRRRAANRARAGTNGGRRPLARAVGAKADPAGLDRTELAEIGRASWRAGVRS